MTNDDDLKRVGERRTLFKTTEERRSNMVGYLLRSSNWFTILIEGMIEGLSGRGRPNQR